MAELKGIYPIVATPFRADGEVDEKSFERLIEFLGGSGVQGLTLFGMAGEYYKLSDDERRTLEAIFLKNTWGRLKRIVSVTEHSIELARKRAWEAAGSRRRRSNGDAAVFSVAGHQWRPRARPGDRSRSCHSHHCAVFAEPDRIAPVAAVFR